jgi:uncharacterized protein
VRTSSYVIYVDLPGDSEQMLLVHGYTGALELPGSSIRPSVASGERRRNKTADKAN